MVISTTIIEKGLKSSIREFIIQEGLTLEEAVEKLKNLEASDQHSLIDKIAKQIKEEQESHVKINESITGLRDEIIDSWYTPQDDDVLWHTYKKTLEEKKFSEKAIKDIDVSTSKILNSTHKPLGNFVNTRGLVVGYVQSGKTANYIGLIAKAADAGYKLIIVLTGTKESLRRQTQQRINEDLINKNADKWHVMTKSRDFRKHQEQKPEAMMSTSNSQACICVVKKNQSILLNLVNWLTKKDGHTENNPRLVDENIRAQCPLLIIDDECDEASINVSRREEQSRIYQRIMNLLKAMPRSAYIGYTATPFANVLIDPQTFDGENLYPKHFIYHLPKPENYFGAEDIFGRQRTHEEEEEEELAGKNMFREVPIIGINRNFSDVLRLRPARQNDAPYFEPKHTYSLYKACYYFWASTAAKIARLGVNSHTTMFVHTHVRAIIHDKTYKLIENFHKKVKEKILNEDHKIYHRIKNIWDQERNMVQRNDNEREILFDEIKPLLKDIITRTEIVQKNINNRGDLGYKDELNEDVKPGKIYILIGGNILSRGLTLEGLTVSYFLRTASTYDTLLQMGRWFGFRNGYSDLPRVWMTRTLERNFYRLALVEQEIRDDIKIYEETSYTPLQFGVRIRRLPGIQVTSRLKMKDAVDNKITFDRQRPELRNFPIKNKIWLTENINASKKLINNNISKLHKESSSDRLKVLRNIEQNEIISFINDFHFHSLETSVIKEGLIKYAELLVKKNLLSNWNVAIIGNKKSNLGKITINNDLEINCINRAKLGSDTNPAYFKTVSSKDDVVRDVWVPDDNNNGEHLNHKQLINKLIDPNHNAFQDKDGRHISDEKKLGTRHFFQIRRDYLPKTGLIVIYPISKDSTYRGKHSGSGLQSGTEYYPLEADEHVISFMTIFPPAKDEILGAGLEANYVSANLPDIMDDEGITETDFDDYDEEEENDDN